MGSREHIEIEDVRRLELRPGDVLVFRLPEDTSADAIEFVAERVRYQLGPDIKVLVLLGNVEVEHVRRVG